MSRPSRPALAALGVVGELQDVAHPAGEGVGQVGGHAEDPGDDPDRDLLRVVGRGVGVARVGEAVEQAAAELAGQRHVAVDPLVREPGQQQPAGPGVQRRVGRNRRQAVLEVGPVEVGVGVLVLVAGDDGHLERAEVRDVVRNGGHVVVAGGQPAALAAVGVGDGAALAQLVPDAERVGDVARVEHVEVGRPVLHGRGVWHGTPLGAVSGHPDTSPYCGESGLPAGGPRF